MAGVAYILLSYGPRLRGDLLKHPAAQQQIRNIRQGVSEFADKLHWQGDYARQISSINDLPNLRRLLANIRGTESVIIIDDLCRINRRIDWERRDEFLACLAESGDHLVGLRQKKYFSELGEKRLNLIKRGLDIAEPLRVPAPRERYWKSLDREQTEKARRVSSLVRGRRADAYSRKIAEIHAELALGQHKPTLKEVAEVAKQKGLLSSRGGEVTPQTVDRALKRRRKEFDC